MTWAPDYCELEELKSYVTQPEAVTIDDAEFALAITSASRAIDKATRRQFGLTDLEPRYYTAEYDVASGRYVVITDDISGVGEGFGISLDTDGDQTWSTIYAGLFTRWPLNATAEGRPFERITLPYSSSTPVLDGAVRITAAWGWASVPDTIKQATLLQAARYLKRRDAVFGIAGSPEMGSEVRLLSKLDPDVALMVRSYRRSVMG